MPCTDCDDTNIPEVDETAMECCEITSTDCVHTSEANECFAYGKGVTLTYALKRICDFFKKILERLNTLEDNSCFCPETVVYREDRGSIFDVVEPENDTYYPITQTQYTIPSGGDGVYEIKWLSRIRLTPSIEPLNTSARYDIFLNGTELNAGMYQEVGIETDGDVTNTHTQSLELYRYNVTLAAGDTIDIRQQTAVFQSDIPSHSIYKITKIG